MFKIIIMALLIFIGMVGYDNIKDKAQPTTPVQQEQQKISKHEKSAAMALFTSLLPPKEEWPSPVHKFYLAFNMDEVIDPIRQNPNWTSLDAMSRDIPQALIAIEDHAFYNHGAIEAVLSLMLEDNYSKDEILELYLNTTYFGAGSTGIKQASRTYFGKTPSALTLAEAAVIASLPYAPTGLNPLENPEGCKKRQLLVLAAMHKYGMINQGQLAEAKAEKIRLTNGTVM